MSTDNRKNRDDVEFRRLVRAHHKRVDPCFMTGKGCVYTDIIDREIHDRENTEEVNGFMIMPFRQNVGVFFNNCLRPFFRSNYGDGGAIQLDRADQVRRPGVIICEGICKRIQASDFIVVDISAPNANVFYELGLAYGINQKVIVIYHDKSEFGRNMATYFKDDNNCRCYPYHDLDPIRIEDFVASQYIWKSQADGYAEGEQPGMLLFERLVEDTVAQSVDGDILLDFRTHMLSAVGLAIEKILKDLKDRTRGDSREAHGSYLPKVIESYLPIIEGLKWVETVKPDARFPDIRRQMDRSFCVIVRTGAKCHPMAYFWLGYGHACGKNVIPITVIEKAMDPVVDLAFDIRAQRHMTFIEKAPEHLEPEFRETLGQMIVSDFSEWSRKRFWDKTLGRRGEVYIFTGALHNDTFNREMIGDWDLRTASELTSYFGRHQYRAKIETPIYAPERTGGGGTSSPMDYVKQVSEMMKGKNCILIASPDVNPLTEIVLGKLYGVAEAEFFSGPIDFRKYPNAIVAVKEKKIDRRSHKTKDRAVREDVTTPEYATNVKPESRAFYREVIMAGEGDRPRRGFRSNQIVSGEILEEFISQVQGRSTFKVFAHLAIAPNPFDHDPHHPRYIIVLNGVSGPATFALTHVLTGGMNEEFVSYEKSFNSEAMSEAILKMILDEWKDRDFKALECFVWVMVGPAGDLDRQAASDTFDWRRIRNWGLQVGAFGGPTIRVLR